MCVRAHYSAPLGFFLRFFCAKYLCILGRAMMTGGGGVWEGFFFVGSGFSPKNGGVSHTLVWPKTKKKKTKKCDRRDKFDV